MRRDILCLINLLKVVTSFIAIIQLYYYTAKASFFRNNFLLAHRSVSSTWLQCLAALCLIAAFIFQTSSIATAEENNSFLSHFKNLDTKGYLENESAYRLRSPNRFSKIQNSLEFELEFDVIDDLEFYTRNRFIYDAVYDLESAYEGLPSDNYRLTRNFKDIFQELYLEYTLEDFTITAGKQQVVWGEATGLKITDIVNPTDFREFILDDFLDSRIGLWMLKLNYSFGDSEVEGVLIPDFEPNKSAVSGSEWAFSLPASFEGFDIRFKNTKRPADGLENADFGFRLNTILSSWDISGYYFYSWDDNPALHTFTTGNVKEVFPEHHRLHTAGGTFNYAFGKTVLTGELGLNFGKYFQTNDPGDRDSVVKRNDIIYMLGGEYIINNFTTASMQLVQQVILGKTKFLADDAIDTTITLFIQMGFLNETLKPDLLVLYGANKGGWLFRPKVAYDWNDYLKLTIGFDIFAGPQNSFLGQFNKNNRVIAEIKRSF